MQKLETILLKLPATTAILIWINSLMLTRKAYGKMINMNARLKRHHYLAVKNPDLYLIKSEVLPTITFAGFIRKRMRFNRDQIIQTFCDRSAMRDYVINKIGAKYVPELHAKIQNGDQIPWEKLPKHFFAKTSHGSGGMIGVWSGISETIILPYASTETLWKRYWINPANIDKPKFASILNENLIQNYATREGKLFEWGYFDVPRNIMIEELLIREDGNLASQTAIYCFRGTPKFIRHSIRGEDQKRYFSWRKIDWEPLDFYQISFRGPQNYAKTLEVPRNLEEMLELATKLSSELDFVRVDLYDLGNKVIFGEMTPYPSGGFIYFYPLKYNITLLRYL